MSPVGAGGRPSRLLSAAILVGVVLAVVRPHCRTVDAVVSGGIAPRLSVTSTEATTQELHPATAAGAPPWPRPGPAAPCTQACKDQLHSMADFVQGSLMLRYNQRMVG